MARMTGGEALVKQLYREGVRVVFGLPGVQLYGAVAALRDEPGIRFVVTRHEQATSYMADGYARAGSTFGTALVVPGPGLLNASAGLSTAYAASSPVLMIAGQIPKAQLGKNIGVLHEVNDQLDAIAPITKWRRRVLEVGDVARAAHEAVEQLRTGRPRPVHLEMPPDTMESEGEVELVEPSRTERPAASRSDIDRAAGMLLAAERPVIYAGGGVHLSGCHDVLAAVAEYLQAGVVQSAEGKGALGDASDLSLGAALWPQSALRRYFEAADTVLVVGSRLALAAPKPEQQVIQLDLDGEEIGRNHKKTFGLVGDARATLAQGGARGAARRDRGEHVPGAEHVDPQVAARGGSRGRDRRRGHDPDRLLLASVLARVPAADLPHLVLLGESRLRVSDRAGRQGRMPQAPCDRDLRGRRLPLQLAGACDRGAPPDQRRRRGLQRQRLRQRRAGPGRGLGRELRGRAAQPGLHEARRCVRRGGHAREDPDGRRRARARRDPARSPCADRGARRADGAPAVLRAPARAGEVQALSVPRRARRAPRTGGSGRGWLDHAARVRMTRCGWALPGHA